MLRGVRLWGREVSLRFLGGGGKIRKVVWLGLR